MTRPTHVVLAAGGTAGHIEPALNLADALTQLEPGIEVTVIGGEHGLETTSCLPCHQEAHLWFGAP